MGEYQDKGSIVLDVFYHKQVITGIDSLKHSLSSLTTTVTMDSEDLLFHCLMPNQLCAAGPDSLNGLYFVVFFSFFFPFLFQVEIEQASENVGE